MTEQISKNIVCVNDLALMTESNGQTFSCLITELLDELFSTEKLNPTTQLSIVSDCIEFVEQCKVLVVPPKGDHG